MLAFWHSMYNLVNMKGTDGIGFGTRLREARLAAGETQQAAADAFGISLRGYCRWEKGERDPNFTILVSIADHYGITLDWLLGRTDEAPSGE